MIILAIESSCDETAAALIGDNAQIISNVVVSQVDIFAAYGGVIPEVAARSHLEAILPVIHKALDDANLTKDDVDYIAVTYAPGLLGSLLIGTLTARMLAILWNKPLYAVHHLKSHIYANWLHDPSNDRAAQAPHFSTTSLGAQEGESNTNKNMSLLFSKESQSENRASAPHFSTSPLAAQEGEWTDHNSINKPFSRENKSESKLDSQNDSPVKTGAGVVLSKKAFVDATKPSVPSFPLLALVISGGHTQIIYMPQHNHFEIIGTTRDDAVGECFDKVAKILGLPYPGGPNIAKCAERGDPKKYHLPHPKIDGLDFSFSGLKTAVLRAVQADCNLPITTTSYELASHLTDQQKSDFAASFQSTACDILLEKLQIALRDHPEVRSVVFAGGVSANQVLRQKALAGLKNSLKRDFNSHDNPTNSSAGNDLQIFFPDPKFTGDNAAMVGAAAYYEILSNIPPVDPYKLNILPRTPIK